MKIIASMDKDERALSPVIGVILLVAITVILAAVIGAFVFGKGPQKNAPELYFTSVEVKTSGWINATATGSSIVGVSDLKIIVDDQLFTPSSANFVIDGQPYSLSNNKLTGGKNVALKPASGYQSGQSVRLIVTDIPSGLTICDVTVRVGNT